MEKPEGLHYFPNIFGNEVQQKLLAFLDNQNWVPVDGKRDNGRLVLQYGLRFDYKTYDLVDDVPPIPQELSELQMHVQNIILNALKLKVQFTQLIVNNYLPGQGISPHTDWKVFGSLIACVTLGVSLKDKHQKTLDHWFENKVSSLESCGVMEFANGTKSYCLAVDQCSLYVMHGPSRYEWTHAMPTRTEDIICGVSKKRMRRISLTFRTVVDS